MTAIGHLVRRFATSLSRTPPAVADSEWAVGQLSAREAELWQRMTVQDRRHSIVVARRFAELVPGASRDEMAGALLHDVGKLHSNLGTCGRVLATVIGPRTARLRSYHDHERLGAEMLSVGGSAPATIELVRGRGAAADALRQADDI